MRKQVYELTMDDLRQHPVWEFALDEEGDDGSDEATVRPWDSSAPVSADDVGLIVRARFVQADGAEHAGYLTVPPLGDSDPSSTQPVVVTESGQVLFWNGVVTPTPSRIEDAYRRLKGSAASTFPLKYASDVPGGSLHVGGVLDGFLSYRSFRDQQLVATR